MSLNEDSDSDDDVFFGKLTLKEVKKHIFMNRHQKISLAARSGKHIHNCNDFKIIEANSEPNMHFSTVKESSASENLKSASDPRFTKQYDNPKVPTLNLTNTGDAFEIEKNVSKLCVSPNMSSTNTSEYIPFILNQSETQKDKLRIHEIKQEINGKNNSGCKISIDNDMSELASHNIEKHGQDKHLLKVQKTQFINTLTETPIPKQLLSNKKDSNVKKIPSRLNAYQHVASPVASYIKGQVLTATHSQPKKHLPGLSSIPRPIKTASNNKKCNKENIALTPLAYSSAKKTSVIDINKSTTSKSQRAKKLTSLKKPVVSNHEHREAPSAHLISQAEDSCTDLALNQADDSVYTLKP